MDETQALVDWIDDIDMPHISKIELAEALYACSEHGLWMDGVDSVSVAQCIMCWSLVEGILRNGFPERLRV